MRITRRITTSSVAKEESDDVRASEDEVAAADDDDSEALTAPVTDHERMRVVQCEIAYSPAYQVPVLYLTFAERSTDKSIALPSPDEVYNALVPEDFKSAMRSVGIMGALSMAEHPVTGVPAYFVHPCRTQEALSLMLDNDNSDIDQCNGAKYLLLWFGVIGASVGLNVPIGVAKLFADQSGDTVGELGKC
jgi:ubiquitin-like-conjugating enzyme ATG10